MNVLAIIDELMRQIAVAPDLLVLDTYAKENEVARSIMFGEVPLDNHEVKPVEADSVDLFSFMYQGGAADHHPGKTPETTKVFSHVDAFGDPSPSPSSNSISSSASESSFRNKDSNMLMMRRSSVTTHKVLDEVESVEEDDPTNMSTFSFGDFVMSTQSQDESPVARVKPKANAFMFGDFFVDEPEDTPRNVAPRKLVLNVKQRTVVREKITEGATIGGFSFHTFRSHANRIRGCVVASERENCVISSCEGDTFPRMMSEGSTHPLSLYLGHHHEVTHISVSPDSTLIGAACGDGQLLTFEISTGIALGECKHPCPVRCSCFSKNGKYVVSGGEDGNCRLWASKKKRQTTAMCSYFRQKGVITSLALESTGELVASGSSDTSVHVWSGSTAKLSFVVQERHHGGIVDVCFNPAGDQLLTADSTRAVITDCTSGCTLLVIDAEKLKAPSMKGTLLFSAVLFAPPEFANYVVIFSSDRKVSLYELVADPLATSPTTKLKTPTGQKLRVALLKMTSELWCFYTKNVVLCTSCGPHSSIAYGDASGNVSMLRILSRGGAKAPPVPLFKHASMMKITKGAKTKEKGSTK